MDIIIAALIALIIIVVAVVIAPTVKMALNIAPYLYTNTRCAAKTGLILSVKQYDSLLSTTYERELYALLEDTGYSHIAQRAKDFPTVSPLLEEDLAATYDWLARIAPEKLQPVIIAMNRKFEIQEIKEALNSGGLAHFKHILDTQLRLKLEGATDTQGVIAALEDSPYSSLIQQGTIDPTALDAWYLQDVLRVIDSTEPKAVAPFREYWRRKIDIANIKIALRGKKTFIDGGLIETEKLQSLDEFSQVQDTLQGTPYEGIDTESLAGLENQMEKKLKIASGNISAKHPLYGGPIVRFIVQKEMEIKNLNLILKLKAEKFTTDEIAPMVI